MADETAADNGDQWVIEAPGAGEIKLALGLGEGVELDDEQQAALDQLMEVLHGADVEGFADLTRISGGRLGFDVLGKVSLDFNCGKLSCTGIHICDNLDDCGEYSVVNKLRSR
jgi:hypothetical protein